MSSIKKKYYAVKIGINPGIYTTWDECKKNVSGVKGAQYKSFKTLSEAKEYLSSSKDIKQITKNSRGNKYYTTSKNINLDVYNLKPETVLTTNNISDISLERFKTFSDNGHNEECYYIFTDGSSQKSHSSYGVYFGNGEPEPYTISPTFTHFVELITSGSKTNNTAELKAIQSALIILQNNAECINKLRQIIIISDSQYAIKCITLWYIKWQRNYWLNSKKEQVVNRELIEDILERINCLKEKGLKITFKHQLAHTAKPSLNSGYAYYLWLGNYMVDYLVQKKVINK
jgi:ribonuclease HI